MAEPLLVPQGGGVRSSSKQDTDPGLEDQSPGQGSSQDWGGGAETGACLTCFGSRASWVLSRLAEGSQIPGGSVHVCVSGLRSLGGVVSRGVRVLVYLVQELNFTIT